MAATEGRHGVPALPRHISRSIFLLLDPWYLLLGPPPSPAVEAIPLN
jgi:hypothetical protein